MKGSHLQQYEKAKASAVHREYGRVFMAGYDKGRKDFLLYREESGALFEDGSFEVSRLRWDK